MRILDRYVLGQFLGTFLVVLTALPFLFLITDLTDQLDNYLGRGIPPRSVAVSYVYFMPQLIFWGIPVAALIATVFTVGGMTRHQEITAAKAGGISFYRLSAPLVLVAVLLSGAAVGLGELVPVANRKRAETLGDRGRMTSGLRMNFVLRTENGKTLAANQVNARSRRMDSVVLESRTNDGSMRVHQSASSATWYENDGWTLEDGYVRWLPDEGDEMTFYFTSLRLNDLDERPDDLLNDPKEPEEMRYAELQRFIRMIDRSGGDSSEFRVHLAQKISLPLALLVIVLFGAPLATTSKRGGVAFGVGLSLAVTMVYLMLFKVGEAVGESGTVHPMVAAWSPNVLFFVAALVFLARVRT